MTQDLVLQESRLSTDRAFALSPMTQAFPFEYRLSLSPLVEFWQHTMPSNHPVKGALAARLQEALQEAPELLRPIDDFAVITKHKELVDFLMALAFPRSSWEEAFSAALLPFQLRSFYATPSFERLLMTEDGYLQGRINVDMQTVERVKRLHACLFILCQVYGVDIDFEYPIIFTVTDPDNGLDRHFRMNFDGRFIQVKTTGTIKPLSEAVKQQLLANLGDPQLMLDILQPSQFVLHGFGVLNAVEVTDQEVLSALKRDLIEKESIISKARFNGLQDKLRTLFRKPELFFGLAACQKDHVLVLHAGAPLEHG